MKKLSHDEIKEQLPQVAGWEAMGDLKLTRTFTFDNYYHTIAFVNAMAWMANQCDHHPDLSVHYDRCVVSYHTHTLNGLSPQDFICAKNVNQIYSGDL